MLHSRAAMIIIEYFAELYQIVNGINVNEDFLWYSKWVNCTLELKRHTLTKCLCSYSVYLSIKSTKDRGEESKKWC